MDLEKVREELNEIAVITLVLKDLTVKVEKLQLRKSEELDLLINQQQKREKYNYEK